MAAAAAAAAAAPADATPMTSPPPLPQRQASRTRSPRSRSPKPRQHSHRKRSYSPGADHKATGVCSLTVLEDEQVRVLERALLLEEARVRRHPQWKDSGFAPIAVHAADWLDDAGLEGAHNWATSSARQAKDYLTHYEFLQDGAARVLVEFCHTPSCNTAELERFIARYHSVFFRCWARRREEADGVDLSPSKFTAHDLRIAQAAAAIAAAVTADAANTVAPAAAAAAAAS